MRHAAAVRTILRRDPLRWPLLALVGSLGLPDCWIAAGFVRNAVWDRLHGWVPSPPAGDVDVVWFDPQRAWPREDDRLRIKLCGLDPTVAWSVKNQARMHLRNGDPPYASSIDAMRHWPETATAVAARRVADRCEIAAPFGLDDLFALKLRAGPCFTGERQGLVDDRIAEKQWMTIYPLLQRKPVSSKTPAQF